MLPLTATRLVRDRSEVVGEPAGDLLSVVRAHLEGRGRAGLVVLGGFGSGKTRLCERVALETSDGRPPCTSIPLRTVARTGSIEEGLLKAIGRCRLDEARSGQRVLLLDGLDEVARPGDGSFPVFFDEVTSRSGPRWVLTSRPGYFLTEAGEPEPDQVDVLDRPDVDVVIIDPLPAALVRATLSSMGSAHLLQSVEGLEQLTSSPLLLHVVEAALRFIEPGRPIHPSGVFDAWIRLALDTGPGHDEALDALEQLAWSAFRDEGFSIEGGSFTADQVCRTVPAALRSALLVSDLDGRQRFGHRSVYEFFVANRIAPRLVANQGQGPDELSGLRISEAMRVFMVGRAGPMPVAWEGERVRIPRGNFVAGGDLSNDERPLRIAHLPQPAWLARRPVTNGDWARYLAERPDDRVDAHYLRHWRFGRQLPPDRASEPVHHIWPDDADRYAAWVGARLPSADEWEKAVRGLDGRRWPWGDWFKPGAAVTAETGIERPLPVGAFGASGEAGLFSPIGGVFEYTSSAWRDRPDRGRVVMGGCYTHPAPTSRASLRLSHKLSGNLKAGLRLAWSAE